MDVRRDWWSEQMGRSEIGRNSERMSKSGRKQKAPGCRLRAVCEVFQLVQLGKNAVVVAAAATVADADAASASVGDGRLFSFCGVGVGAQVKEGNKKKSMFSVQQLRLRYWWAACCRGPEEKEAGLDCLNRTLFGRRQALKKKGALANNLVDSWCLRGGLSRSLPTPAKERFLVGGRDDEQ